MSKSKNRLIADLVSGGGVTDENFTFADHTKLDGIEAGANNFTYTHPSSHPVSFITGLQTALNGKVDDSQVLTNVPSGALFTDTNTVFSGNYNDLSNRPTIPTNNNQLSNGAGFTTYSANQAVNNNSNVTFNDVILGTADFGNWEVFESSNVLYFRHNGSNKMKLDSSGNMTVVGNVTAYGSV